MNSSLTIFIPGSRLKNKAFMHLSFLCSLSYVHLRFPLRLVRFQFLKREIDKLIRCDFHSRLTSRFACFPLKSKNSNRCVAIFIRALRLNNRNNRRIGKIMDHNSYYTILRFSTYRTLLACGLITRLTLRTRYTCTCSLVFHLLDLQASPLLI